MDIYTRNLNQEATYWPPGTSDGYGRRGSTAPVLVMCRWQDQASLVRNAQGEEVTSSAVVYVDTRMEVGGFLAKGDFTAGVDSDGVSEPREVDGAMAIIAKGSSPSLDARMELLKVWL